MQLGRRIMAILVALMALLFMGTVAIGCGDDDDDGSAGTGGDASVADTGMDAEAGTGGSEAGTGGSEAGTGGTGGTEPDTDAEVPDEDGGT